METIHNTADMGHQAMSNSDFLRDNKIITIFAVDPTFCLEQVSI